MTNRPLSEALAGKFKMEFKDSVNFRGKTANLAEILKGKMNLAGKFRAILVAKFRGKVKIKAILVAKFRDKTKFKAILASKFKDKAILANNFKDKTNFKTKEAFFIKANAGTALRGVAFYTPSSRARM